MFKLVINVSATMLLLTCMKTFSYMASVAADPGADVAMVRKASPVVHDVLALLMLLRATILAVYKRAV